MISKKNIYLFDFDGTITSVDTLFDFLKNSFPKEYKLKYLKFIFHFILVKLKIREAETVKQRFISSFLKGKTKSEINSLSENYFNLRKKHILRSRAIEYMAQIDSQDEKYIVTASLDIWVEPFAKFLGTKLICTKAEFDSNELFTGRFSTPNCNYQEKKNRILKEIDLESYSQIFAFGDSKGDFQMFSLATKTFFKPFL